MLDRAAMLHYCPAGCYSRGEDLNMRRVVRFSMLVAALTVVAGVLSAGSALAYGHADQPIAQVEISGNCNNPSFPLCAPEEQGGVGLGGVWTWAELDTVGTDGTYGSMDYTISFCGHTIGGGGPGSAGGLGTPGEGEWWTIANLADAPPLAFPFFDTSKSYDAYYVLDYFPGTGEDDFIAVVPAAYGHYGLHPVRGVTIQTQVAP
jgi:hypothetical protein